MQRRLNAKPETGRIESITPDGFGVVHKNQQKILIPFVLPEELIRYGLRYEENGIYYAEVLEIKEASSERVTPLCKYFGTCGGCVWQHVDYLAQLKWKHHFFKLVLKNTLKSSSLPLQETVEHHQPYHYRRKINLKANRKGELGYYQRGSNQVVPIERCELAEEAINNYLPTLREKAFSKTQEKMRTYELDFELRLVDGQVVEGDRQAADFIQVNEVMNQQLKNKLQELLANQKFDQILELHAGAGNFSEVLVQYTPQLTTVESNQFAVQQANRSVGAGYPRPYSMGGDTPPLREGNKIIIILGFSTRILKQFVHEKKYFDLIFLDPPRRGAKEEVMQILKLAPQKIIYVSCNPESLARDLAILCSGGYHIETIIPFDFFPQTMHLESLTVLSRS